jgi:type II secretory pathway pseudopilin PulG
MAAVMIIAILAAVSLPGISERLRDRYASEVAQDVALFYRQARMRAVGRGAAQMVSFTTSPVVQGQFTLSEGVQPLAGAGTNLGTCGNLPQSGAYSCLNTSWTAGSPDTRFVTALTVGANRTDIYSDAVIDGAVLPSLDICFSPSSRSYYRQNAGAVWQPLTTVPKFQVSRMQTGQSKSAGNRRGLIRELIIPPNGGARLVL